MRNITVASWNINGHRQKFGSVSISKFDDPEFKSVLTEDIVCLMETHTGPTDNIEIGGYTMYEVKRPRKKKGGSPQGALQCILKTALSML